MPNTEELWKDIPGYEGSYQISNTGKVKSLARMVKKFNTTKMQEERLLSISTDGRVTLSNRSRTSQRRAKVSELVAEAFPNI